MVRKTDIKPENQVLDNENFEEVVVNGNKFVVEKIHNRVVVINKRNIPDVKIPGHRVFWPVARDYQTDILPYLREGYRPVEGYTPVPARELYDGKPVYHVCLAIPMEIYIENENKKRLAKQKQLHSKVTAVPDPIRGLGGVLYTNYTAELRNTR